MKVIISTLKFTPILIKHVEPSTLLKIILCTIFVTCFLALSAPDVFSLTPMVDLSGKWSGSAQLRDTDGYCTFSGSVSAVLQQNGNALNGQYQFTVTSSKSTGKLEGMESCSLDSASGTLTGFVDGTVVTMVDSEGLRLSGTATNDLLILDFGDQYVVGTAKLQKFADFSKPKIPAKSEPDTVQQMIKVGVSYLNEKRFDKALEYFSKITGKEPNNIMGWMGKGVSLVGLKNYDQAITHFKKSLEIDPDNKDVLQWLGRSYYLKNNCNVAADYYSAALRSDPQNPKMLAEKKIIDSCLTKQTEAKSKQQVPETIPEPKSESKPEPGKLDYSTIKSTLDKIQNPESRAKKALEILKQLPSGPIPDDLQDLFSNGIYGKLWVSSKNKSLLIEKLQMRTGDDDGSVNVLKPSKQASSDKAVYFVNGVLNTPQMSDDNAQALANMLERPVKRVYNKSDGLSDFTESVGLKLNLLKNNPSVKSLIDNIMSDLEKGETVEIHSHSEGAIITSAALTIIKENNPDFFAKNANKISVNTYGGASWTYPEGPAYNHMTFYTDPIPLIAGRTILAENLLLKTNPEKISGLPGHAFTGYVQDMPRFIINKHSSLFSLDTQSLGKDLANYNPKLFSSVLAEVGLDREEEVTYHFVKNLDDSRLKNLPKSQLNAMQKNLEFGKIKEFDNTQLDRINRALGIK
ncbi:MAG: tetratricopeptide repeat protein [Candidatus Nitrosotenuis sp.]